MADHFTYLHRIKKKNKPTNFSGGLGSLNTNKATGSMVYGINI